MNKGTSIIGFLLCFLSGMGLMWGIDRNKTAGIEAESGSSTGSLDQSGASIPVTGKDPQWGKPDAPVTVVIFSDFQCPFCSRVEPTLKQVRDKYGPDKVRLVWKNQPLPFHQNARPAADAAATVFGLAGNDAFWKFHDLAFQNQQNLNDASYEKWAAEAGVDVNKFKQALAAKKFTAKVDEDMALGTKVGASGTPAFRINGVTLVGAQPVDKFNEVIDAQLSEAKKLIAAGTKPADVYVALTKKNFQAPADEATGAAKPGQQPTAKPQQPAEDDKTVWKVPVTADDPIKGPKDALVTIVEWSDFQCPFCKRVEDTLKQIAQSYPNDVRFVWKDNPLPFHPRAKPSAILARYAYKTKGDKGFWDAHDALFESNPKLEDDDLKTIAAKVGLSWDSTKAAIDGNKYADKLDADADLAMDLQARGTPHFFINGRRLSGAQPFESFKKLIDEEIAHGKALVGKGVAKGKVYEEIIKEGKEPPPPEKKDVPPPDASMPWKGGQNAKVVIQMFSDFECPFCKRVEPTIKELEQQFGNKIKIVWRQNPLPFHQHAMPAAIAAQEAFEQKGNAGFWAMHDKLFDANGTPDGLERANIEKIGAEIGLDAGKLKAALDSEKHKARIQKDLDAASKAGIQGTPSFVINGYYVSGAQPTAAFAKLINKALKE